MNKQEIENFLEACDELIECKFLVAEYKISKLLQSIASSSDICSLISECLESYNRDREFSRTYIQDGRGQFVCMMPTEEYKVVALVFCTLADIDNKKIDFNDFIKRFFGREENPFVNFLQTMIVPFKNLIAEAFGFNSQKVLQNNENNDSLEDKEFDEKEDDDQDYENKKVVDKFETSTKIAVQILSELEELRDSRQVEDAHNIASSIIKTASFKDETILKALTASLKYVSKYVKSIRFLVRDLSDVFFD